MYETGHLGFEKEQSAPNLGDQIPVDSAIMSGLRIASSRKMKSVTSRPRRDLASLVRGIYGRVARRLRVDPSYVSRIARGERRSDAIEAELRRELDRIIKQFSKRQRTDLKKTQKSKRLV